MNTSLMYFPLLSPQIFYPPFGALTTENRAHDMNSKGRAATVPQTILGIFCVFRHVSYLFLICLVDFPEQSRQIALGRIQPQVGLL